MTTNDLVAAATAVREQAYAPYSGFAVGAALRTVDGEVFVGCNVENAAYPEGTCAEAGAIAAMVAGGGSCIAEIAVVCGGDLVGTPCGGCRQKIREFAAPDVVVYVADLHEIKLTFTMDELLPESFGPDHLDSSHKT